jgi:hypothetical protein
MHCPSRILPLVVATAIALVACASRFWEAPTPGSVMAERLSPDNSLLARVAATEIKGTYALEVRNGREGTVFAKRIISAPVGYHPHVVSLTWRADSRIVTATIDHDFGDDNRVFELHLEHTEG